MLWGRLFEALGIPTVYSAPASFHALPVESVFKYLKLTDFRERHLPINLFIKNMQHDELTKKQYLLAQVASYITSISNLKMKTIYFERLKRLRVFLGEERVSMWKAYMIKRLKVLNY
jgi:hypothetical protein